MSRPGRLPVGAVTGADVLAVLEPVWTMLDEARRIKQRMNLVMQWAGAQGYREDPAGDVLSAALPTVDRTSTPRRALPYAVVPAALEKVRASGAGASIWLDFEAMVLCAVRSGEARLATWDEVDL